MLSSNAATAGVKKKLFLGWNRELGKRKLGAGGHRVGHTLDERLR